MAGFLNPSGRARAHPGLYRRITELNIAAGYAEHLVATWNARQEAHMPMLFSPGAALAARHWFLWVRYPACRITNAVDLRAFMKLSRDCHDFIDKMDTHYPVLVSNTGCRSTTSRTRMTGKVCNERGPPTEAAYKAI